MIFLDTSFLFALFAESDENHERVKPVIAPYRGRPLKDFVVTTNHIVGETITLVRVRSHKDTAERHRLAVEVGRELFAGVFGTIHQATAKQEREAFAYLEHHKDKEYSFADCLSFVVMDELGIEVAWAVDSDFTHRFTAIPGPKKK